MWKDTDLYCKRDDDSAIGDSENNSTEEESMNFRRKSSISDDLYEITVEPHLNLETKLGTKTPECLLKDCDATLLDCQKAMTNNLSSKAKTKREIVVLPNAAAAAAYKKPNSEITKSVAKEHNLLETKLKFLLNEMKQLRELDKEILRKFMELNEDVEEVRTMLVEEEEDMKRKLEEEDAEEDVCLVLKDDPEFDSSLNRNHNVIVTSPTTHVHDKVSSQNVTATSRHASVAAESYGRKGGQEAVAPAAASYSSTVGDQSRASIDVRAASHVIEKRSADERCSDPAKRKSTSDIWVVREEYKSSPSETGRNPQEKHRPKSSTAVPPVSRRHSEVSRPVPKSRSQPNAFKLVTDENTRIGRLTPWAVSEAGKDRKAPFKPSVKQRYLVDVSRSRNFASVNPIPVVGAKASDSSTSLNSSSSRTSSESSSSATLPAKNPVKRSNSTSKWSRFLSRRSSKTSTLPNNKNGLIITNNNYKVPEAPPRQIDDPVLRSRSVVSVSYKRTSPVASSRWTHHQDDVTFL